MDGIELWANRLGYEIFLLALGSPLFMAMGFVADRNESSGGGSPMLRAIGILLAVPTLLYFGVSLWLAHRAAWRRVVDRESFFGALEGAVADGKFHLAFLPLIGRWFQPPSVREANPWRGSDDGGDRPPE